MRQLNARQSRTCAPPDLDTGVSRPTEMITAFCDPIKAMVLAPSPTMTE
jgi:hypothetical protein